MCGEQLVLAHRRREQVLEEVGRRHRALTALARDDQLGVERQDRRPAVTGRVGVHERAAEGAAVPDLRVGDLADRLVQQAQACLDRGVREDLVVRHHRPDQRRCRPRRRCSLQRVDPADVDDQLGRVEPHPEHRQQRLATGDHLGVVALRRAPRAPPPPRSGRGSRTWRESLACSIRAVGLAFVAGGLVEVRCRTSGGRVGSAGVAGMDRPPDPLGGARHLDVADPELAYGVDDRVDDGRGRGDRACLADALGAERVGQSTAWCCGRRRS